VQKKYTVDITASAEADIADIWDYIAQDDADSATTFILGLEEHIGTLESFPEHCPLVPENEILGTAYRHLLFGHYRTIFRLIGAKVFVLRVIHGARLLDAGMLEEPEK
jgi:toxin ParE1/3/4